MKIVEISQKAGPVKSLPSDLFKVDVNLIIETDDAPMDFGALHDTEIDTSTRVKNWKTEQLKRSLRQLMKERHVKLRFVINNHTTTHYDSTVVNVKLVGTKDDIESFCRYVGAGFEWHRIEPKLKPYGHDLKEAEEKLKLFVDGFAFAPGEVRAPMDLGRLHDDQIENPITFERHKDATSRLESWLKSHDLTVTFEIKDIDKDGSSYVDWVDILFHGTEQQLRDLWKQLYFHPDMTEFERVLKKSNK